MTLRFAFANLTVLALVGCLLHAANAKADERCPVGWHWSDCGSACPPTCDDLEPKCEQKCTPGCFCHPTRPITMAKFDACGTKEMCNGRICTTVACHFDEKTQVNKITHTGRETNEDERSYKCGVMSKTGKCECICMKEEHVADEL